jgi:hypothetical protein
MADVETMVAIGDSVVWGQGLPHDEKFVTQAFEALSDGKRLDERNLKAHSGAVIGVDFSRSDARSGEIQLPGVEQKYGPIGTRTGRHEKPSAGQTILQQLDRLPYDYLAHDGPGDDLEREADRAYDREADVDLVLLDGGINDVGVFSAGLDFGDRDDLARTIDRACYEHLSHLIARTRRKFPTATLVVTSYFPYVSRESDLNLRTLTDSTAIAVGALLGLAFGPATGIIAGIVVGVSGRSVRNRIVDNVSFFNRHQLAGVRRAVAEANRTLAGPGVVFASPRFRPENSSNAPDAWLWPIRDGAVPTGTSGDSRIAELRGTVCDDTGGGTVCENAATAHPNPDGADAYTRAILERYREHRESRVREPIGRLRGGPDDDAVSVREQIERYGFDPTHGLRPELVHTTVDSLTIEFESLLRGPASVVLCAVAGETFPIGMNVPSLGPGGASRYDEQLPIDPIVSTNRSPTHPIRLWEINDVRLWREPIGSTDPGGDSGIGGDRSDRLVWEVDRVALSINGIEVFENADGRRIVGTEELVLSYPTRTD